MPICKIFVDRHPPSVAFFSFFDFFLALGKKECGFLKNEWRRIERVIRRLGDVVFIGVADSEGGGIVRFGTIFYPIIPRSMKSCQH